MNKIKIRKKIPRKGYASSLIQQHFGELPENHGYLLWDIENGDIKEKNIENDYKFINIDINQKTDINNLKVDIPKSDKVKVKIKWEDFGVNMNTENERKIRDIVKNITGTDSIEIEPRQLYTDINDGKMLSDTIDINDKTIQQNILKEYLVGNMITNDMIEKIIDIDNIINDRLNIKKSKNIKWGIDKFWFNNFKSYGDKNIIDWENKNGIIQIGGINQQGKSTILDAISYILYGTTIATQKREKNGDNRYINNNRKKDNCDGGAIIDINGEKYLIYRKTERKIKRTGEITSVSTQLDYYKGVDIIEENKLVGEKRTDTQKDIELILGDFNDFIRLTFTSADNVNDLLSMDRSQFIDNIIKDAGFDIFDKKLNEFKEYKKELNLEKINLNIEQVTNEILEIKEQVKNHNNDINLDKEIILNYEKLIKDKQNEKEKLIEKLNKIDENIIKIDFDNIKKEIEELKIDINNDKEEINKLNFIISTYPSDFDNNLLNNKKNKYEELKEIYLKKKDNIKNSENLLIEKKYEIKDIDNKLENKKKEIENSYQNIINEINNNIKIKENEINSIKKYGQKIKDEIDLLENSDKETKICPTCLKPLNENDIEHFKKEIEKRKEELKNLSMEGKNKLKEIDDLKINIEKNKKNVETDEIFKNYSIDLNNEKKKIESNLININDNISSIKETLKESEPLIKELKDEIKDLELEKERFEFKFSIESNVKDVKIKINEKKEKYNNFKFQMNEYEKNKKFIDENNIIQIDIKNINDLIDEKVNNIKSLNIKISDNNQKVILKNKIISDYNEKIKKYNYQKELEFLHNTYMKSMHRDGLPTYLLKKSIHIINNELSSLLNNVNFSLLFDDNLNLKMKSKISFVDYNAVEGSGMERTFNSVVLKIALRKINNTSKPNFILFDEIMNKLVDNSVDYFIDLLYILKEHIDKIILIEHIHQLKYDYLINVKKDKNGISSFEFI